MNTFPNMHHLEALRNGQRSLNNALQLIDQAEACGIDCQEYRQGLASLSAQSEQLIRTFFPDQPLGTAGKMGTDHE